MAGAPLLFGGSFDPIHLGHLIAAEFAAEALRSTEVWFVPAREQPFKVGRHGASAEHRLRMLRVAVAGHPRFRVDAMELERPAPSYTVDTVRALAARLNARVTLLVGSDAARELPTWREADELLRLADVAVYERAGQSAGALPYAAQRITVPLVGISATEIRERVGAGRTIRYLVPEAVRAYITGLALYRHDDDSGTGG